ncbi:unannotated protein [freshwater metagenome]|uniref:Unannotated protein n=1 Tax=freshwater metagenome TaxID=449393 RepID=A0A6J6DSI6_9ZZZZ
MRRARKARESPGLTPAQVASTLIARSVTVSAGPLLQTLPRWPLTVARSGAGSGLVTSTGGAIDCGPSCSTVVDDGAAITLQATPSQGSRFLGWSGACTGPSAGCTVTVTDTTSVGAEFGPAACASVSASGRVGWWQGSGSTVGVSGPTLSGAVGYGPGFVGDGFVFDGSGSLSSTALPTVTDAITVMAWVRPSSMMRVQSVISRSRAAATLSPSSPSCDDDGGRGGMDHAAHTDFPTGPCGGRLVLASGSMGR